MENPRATILTRLTNTQGSALALLESVLNELSGIINSVDDIASLGIVRADTHPPRKPVSWFCRKVIVETKEIIKIVKVMEKPDLSQMWETFVRIGMPPIPLHQITGTIRTKIDPMVSFSHNSIMAWYCFLIHDRTSGVPTTEDDKNAYFHIRFTVKKDISIKDEKDINRYLPDYCEKSMTRRCNDVGSIQGIEKSILIDEDIAESWKLIGEQSEWVLSMLNGHKENAQIPVNQLVQFMHFYMNMLGLGGQSILFLGPILPF